MTHKLVQKIAEEIRAAGAIPFSRFMELALYCPEFGYYEGEKDRIGKRGDYFTSVSVGSLFGHLLARQFTKWFPNIGYPCSIPAKIAEAGAHDGLLAKDILDWLRQYDPVAFQNLEYWILEPSSRRRDWQGHLLGDHHEKVRWVRDLEELEHHHPEGFQGVIFSNELLDAMPVQRLGWDSLRRAWFEWGVSCEGGSFVWKRLEPPLLSNASHPLLSRLPNEMLHLLPDGFTTEFSPAALSWWERAGHVLRSGALVTFDYGLSTEEFFLPHRCGGTLRTYRSHRQNLDILSDPGEQDITAHVNFSLIAEAGERAGLSTQTLTTQAQFLTTIAARIWSSEEPLEKWEEKQTRQFSTLTHPEGLGRAFTVLVQLAPRPDHSTHS